MKIDFREEQKFTQWWLWIILLPMGVLSILGVYEQVIPGENNLSGSTPEFGLILSAMFVFLLVGLFLAMRLITGSGRDPYQFLPFYQKENQVE